MSRALFMATFSFLAFVSVVHADDAIANAQQALKDQGFYYGEITGHKDADTTAAIRRYQIRNGLKVTGELNNETQRSLHVTGTTTAPQRVPAVPHQPMQDDSDLSENQPHTYEPPPPQSRAPQYGAPQYGASPIYPNEPYRYREAVYGIFSGTPYERASIGVQQRIVFNAQLILARHGYYRSDIDGVYGPGTAIALRAFQIQRGLPPTGRFDLPTLGALGLMPGQRPSIRYYPPRGYPRPVYRGQWIPG